MHESIQQFLEEDHRRIDDLLARSEREDGSIDELTYAQFRGALLRHIAMEEKVLLPAARAARMGEPLPTLAVLRSEHGAIAKLLVRSPSKALVRELRATLTRHNELEEGPGGLYAFCDGLLGDESAALVARLDAQPEVPLAKYYDGPPHDVRSRSK